MSEQPENTETIISQKARQAVKHLCADGYQAYDLGDYNSALRLFYQAWLQLPKPQTQFTEAGWVLTAIGDAYFQSQQYPQSIEALRSAQHCPDIDSNPFVHLRLGQALLDSGHNNEARKHLLHSYKLSGRTLFDQENVRYLEQISDLIE
jgi:tetratricopeptide (TPR) repeat protein